MTATRIGRSPARVLLGVGLAPIAGSLALLGCEGDDGTGPLNVGTVVVSLRTVGVELDTDGYRIRIDDGDPQHVDVNGTVTFTDVREGPRTVALSGVTVTCDPEGGDRRGISVDARATLRVEWSINCTAKPMVFTSGANHAYLYRMNLDGTGVRRLGTVEGHLPRWSPDGTRILFEDDTGLLIMTADGTNSRRLTAGTHGTWSPDGTRIAFFRAMDGWGYVTQLFTIQADGTGETPIGETGHAYHPDWGPDGRIAFVEFDHSEVGEATPNWLTVMNADGSDPVRLVSSDEHMRNPSWSPDGRRIAFVVRTPDESIIYTVGADGSGLRRRTGAWLREDEPRWLADGKTLVFTSQHGEPTQSDISMGPSDSESSTKVSHFVRDDRSPDVRRAP